jgi:hypothetical protein
MKLRKYIAGIMGVTYGAIGFSSLSYYLAVNVVGLPFYLWEHVVVAAIYMVYVHGNKQSLSRSELISLISLISIWLLFVVITNVDQFFYVLSAARPWFIIGIFALLSKRVSQLPDSIIFQVICGAVIGEFLSYFIQMNSPGWDGKIYFSYMVICYFIILSFRMKRLWVLISCITAMAYVVLSGFRILLLVAMLVYVQMIIFRKYRSGVVLSYRTNMLLVGVISFSLVMLYYLSNQGYIDQYLFFRIFQRTLGFLAFDFGASQDGDKIYMLSHLFSLKDPNIIPAGFNMVRDGNVGLYMDNPLLHILNVFGYPLGAVVVCIILITSFAYYVKYRDCVSLRGLNQVSLVFVSIFPFLLMLNGRFLYITYDAALFGLILGRWINVYTIKSQRHIVE